MRKPKALLKEAGAEGLKVELTYSGSDSAQATQAAMIQEQLAAVGITCSLNGMDSTAMIDQLAKGRHNNSDIPEWLYYGY